MSNSRALHHPGSFPHLKGIGDAFMVGTVGFFGKEDADPLLVRDQWDPRSPFTNGLDPTVAQQEARCTVLVHNQTVECHCGEGHPCLGSETYKSLNASSRSWTVSTASHCFRSLV